MYETVIFYNFKLVLSIKKINDLIISLGLKKRKNHVTVKGILEICEF